MDEVIMHEVVSQIDMILGLMESNHMSRLVLDGIMHSQGKVRFDIDIRKSNEQPLLEIEGV